MTRRTTRRFTSTATDPYERGHEFGAAHAGEIAATLDVYRRLFGAGGIGPDEAAALGGKALARVDPWAPELAEEIRGIAAGARFAVEQIAALNARTEIISRYYGRGECSTVVALGGAQPVAMQNWDWYGAMADGWLEWTVPHADGRRVTTLTEFGVVGKIGVNDRGVGTLFNILHHQGDGADMGVPVHIIARRILDTAASVDDAVRIAGTVEVCASTAITIVDGADAASLELWPGGLGVVRPDSEGVLLRTNHFLTDAARPGDIGPTSGSDTLARYAHLVHRLGGRANLGPEDALEALQDHTAGVCCHPAPGADPDLEYATLATVSLDLAGRRLGITAGTPCGTD